MHRELQARAFKRNILVQGKLVQGGYAARQFGAIVGMESKSDRENIMKTFWKAVPWIGKVLILLSTAIFIMISIQPIAHPAANAAAQGIAFTSSLGSTVFRVSFGGFPLGCAVFLVYCLISSRRTLTGLIFSAVVLGMLLLVRIYGMEIDSSVQQSMPLVEPEVALVALMLLGVAIEMGRQSYARRMMPIASTSSAYNIP